MTREARHIIHLKVGTDTGGHPGQTSSATERSLFNLEGTSPWAVDMGP